MRDDLADFLHTVLDEYELDFEVEKVRNPQRKVNEYYVIYESGSESHTSGFCATDEMMHEFDEEALKKHMITSAESAVRQIEDTISETFNWGGRSVQLYEGEAFARCTQCNARTSVDIGSFTPKVTFSAETSTPHPMPRSRENRLSAAPDFSRAVLKLYLIGKLREECYVHCPNKRRPTKSKDL